MVRESIASLNTGILTVLLLLFLPAENCFLSAQPVYSYYYRIYLRDKGGDEPSQSSLSDLFSQRAVSRRLKTGNSLPDFNDLPVNKHYLDQITALGFKLHCTSRWMNSALFKTENPADLSSVMALPFVSDVKVVKNAGTKAGKVDKLAFSLNQADQPPYDRPLTMLNALPVHNSGFTGEGIVIAVLDAGFSNAENITSLQTLRDRGGISGTRDFVLNDNGVFNYHYHGTAVLSVLAGSFPDFLEGSGPGANYWLLRTEDPDTEFPVEEDFWIAGAEYADSVGADIISSSLGYFNFDDSSMNYKYSDFDGRTAFVTRGADIAVSKGILVVNSAGNERNSAWIHIIAPSDGINVIAAGAVDGNKVISSFSSAGPSYDRRIKPDVVAQGVSVPVQIETASVSRSSGTSFSCPVISGLCACVLQAVPKATPYDIIEAIKHSSDRFLNPDSLYGYGIPDFTKVIYLLQEKFVLKPGNNPIAFPNPFTDKLQIIFNIPPERLRIELYTLSGEKIFGRNFEEYISRSIELTNLSSLKQGVYFLRLGTQAQTTTLKLVKSLK